MATQTRRRTTIREVAARAGVSFKSVSNVINDRPFVSEELRRKVQQAIAELDYRPDAIARSLASRRTNILGVVLRASAPDGQADPFLSQFLLGACTVASAQNFGMLVKIILSDEPIRRYADVFGHRQVDGLINFYPRIDDAPGAEHAAHPDLPVVCIGRVRPESDALAVDADSERGAFLAVNHLIALGHRRIGMVANANPAYTVSMTRIQGYRHALAAHDMPFDEELLTTGHYSLQSGHDQMIRLLDRPKPPSAVFVSSDRMALGAMRAASERGLCIPRDIAIVGFDNLVISEYTNPPLTTVQTPIDSISTHSTQMLIDAIRGVHIEPRQLILPVKLVVRRSCGAAPDAESPR